MSERKTAEIKFRVTPSFKASLQAAAAAADETMSEYIEKAIEQREWARQNQHLDGTLLLNNAIATLADPDGAPEPTIAAEETFPAGNENIFAPDLVAFVSTNVAEAGSPLTVEKAAEAFGIPIVLNEFVPPGLVISSVTEDPTSVDIDPEIDDKPKYPWQFHG